MRCQLNEPASRGDFSQMSTFQTHWDPPQWVFLLGYQADTPIAIKAEAIHEADSQCH